MSTPIFTQAGGPLTHAAKIVALALLSEASAQPGSVAFFGEPLHWNLAHADQTVFGCRSRRWRLGGLAGLCAGYAPSQYFSAAAFRVFDAAHCGGVEEGGRDSQRTGVPALARVASQAIVEGGRVSFRARGYSSTSSRADRAGRYLLPHRHHSRGLYGVRYRQGDGGRGTRIGGRFCACGRNSNPVDLRSRAGGQVAGGVSVPQNLRVHADRDLRGNGGGNGPPVPASGAADWAQFGRRSEEHT